MKQESLGKLITLQCYETFNISFNIQESLNTLSLVDAKPTGIVLTYDIKNSSGNSLIESPDGANSQENSVSLSYDATIHLEVNLSNENNYNKFFTITGLELNGKTIFSINEPNKDYGYGVSLKQTALQGEEQLTTTFILSGINANHAGDYNVILTRNTYYLKTSVFDVGTEETGSIIPGKFKTNSNNNPTEEDVLELRYGEQYILNTSITNTDYSDKAFWYIFKNDQSDAFQQPTIFAPTEESANQYANSFQFTFNENCELFNQGENSLATILNLDDYAQKTDGEVVTSNYEIKIVYVKRVKQVKVVLMFNNEEEEQIKTQIAILAVANNSDNLEYKSDRFEWSQEEGVYYAKLPFDKGYITEYIIKIAQMEAGYEFDDWYFDFDIERLTNIDDDELAGGFDVSEDTEEPLVIYCVFKQNQKSLGANLLWLWLTLAGVGAVVLIIIMVIVAKKKRARSSYKKYYF